MIWVTLDQILTSTDLYQPIQQEFRPYRLTHHPYHLKHAGTYRSASEAISPVTKVGIHILHVPPMLTITYSLKITIIFHTSHPVT